MSGPAGGERSCLECKWVGLMGVVCLLKEKQALAVRLEESERRWEETQRVKQEKAMEALTVQQQYVQPLPGCGLYAVVGQCCS